jgi:glycerate kinase
VPRVLLAPDKFKGSLPAAAVADAVSRGLRRGLPDLEVVSLPIADGGDGTVAAALAAGFDPVEVTATGPTGEPVRTTYARRGHVAVIEMADVSGLARLPGGSPAPLTATSRGTGEVVAAAIEAGCRHVVLGIGGSASTDAGAGLAQALGARILDRDGRDVGPGGGALAEVASIDPAPLRSRTAGVRFTVACDVDNPLTGPSGAAAVYGPQKGGSPQDVELLDAALGRFADVVAPTADGDRRDVAGAGAAGGVGFAALALLGADLRPGIDLVLELVGFDEHLDGVDLVVTGEGSLDRQTLHGKAVAGVAARAAQREIPVVAVCGQNSLDPAELTGAGVRAAYALTEHADLATSLADPAPLLEIVGRRIAVEHLAASWTEATA